MGDRRVIDAQCDFLVLNVVVCGQIWWQRKCHLACASCQRNKRSSLSLIEVPNGPATSTADTGTSFFRLLTLDFGKSKKRSDTSGGIGIAALPIREWLVRDDENVRA